MGLAPGPPLLTWITLIPALISNHMPSKVCDEITYSFPNFNGCTVEVWKWISDFIPDFIIYIITYPCCDWSNTMLVKGVPVIIFPCPCFKWIMSVKKAPDFNDLVICTCHDSSALVTCANLRPSLIIIFRVRATQMLQDLDNELMKCF